MDASARALPFYPWFWRDHRADRRAQRLTLPQEGALRLLLDECWSEGMIPSNPPDLAEILRCSTAEVREVWPAIERFFIPAATDGYLINRRIEGLRTKSDHDRAIKARAGRMGGIAKVSAQMELLAPAKHLPSKRLSREENSRSKKSKELHVPVKLDAIVAEWNEMATRTGAAKIIALTPRRLTSLTARRKESGWAEMASRAIAFLGTDPWFTANPDAIRFDALIRPGKVEEYCERASVKRNGKAPASRGGARDDVDRGIHEQLEQGGGRITEGSHE